MLKLELVETDKHSIIILLRRKNLRFLRRTNHIQTRCSQYQKNVNTIKKINRRSKETYRDWS